MIREATPYDVDFLTNLCVWLAKTEYDRLTPRPDAIKDLVTKAISSPQCKTLISYDASGNKGGLISLAHDGHWFERKISSLSMVYTPIPGDTLKMLRAWKKFAFSRPAFKVVEVGFPVRDPLRAALHLLGFRAAGTHFSNMR
jgi:hypothetical protein